MKKWTAWIIGIATLWTSTGISVYIMTTHNNPRILGLGLHNISTIILITGAILIAPQMLTCLKKFVRKPTEDTSEVIG